MWVKSNFDGKFHSNFNSKSHFNIYPQYENKNTCSHIGVSQKQNKIETWLSISVCTHAKFLCQQSQRMNEVKKYITLFPAHQVTKKNLMRAAAEIENSLFIILFLIYYDKHFSDNRGRTWLLFYIKYAKWNAKHRNAYSIDTYITKFH